MGTIAQKHYPRYRHWLPMLSLISVSITKPQDMNVPSAGLKRVRVAVCLAQRPVLCEVLFLALLHGVEQSRDLSPESGVALNF